MSDHITPGEADPKERTAFFSVFTQDGLLADGGSDGDYEGTALGTPDLIEYEHNADGWITATGTFAAMGSGEFYYIFSPAEIAVSRSNGRVAVRITKANFRRQTVSVQFGNGIQPGDTGDQSKIFTQVFALDGRLANGGSNIYYETTVLSAPTLEWDHNLLGFAAAAGTLTQHDDEWIYQPTAAETDAALARGNVAIRISKPGVVRTQVARRGFGDRGGGLGVAPIITAITPVPGAAPGTSTGFSSVSDAVVVTITDAGVAGLAFIGVTVKIDTGDEEVAYRDGAFRGRYTTSSAAGTSAQTLTLRRRGGWVGTTLYLGIDALDNGGSLTSTTFTYALPRPGTIASGTTVDLKDHLTNALNRLPEQFRSKQAF